MPVINILDPHVADLIAAGEVVERPASVIKELMENAFDAGAKNLKVEIRGGGAPFIRVTDDGCGMAPEDAGIAFTRHATSKLRDARGLEAISTMGFRGEALAAIASVSHIELITRKKGESEGTRLTLNAGDIEDMQPTGCPEGTSITVRDIFFNTPARLKFLKSDRAEAGACTGAALRCALGRPQVSVRFLRDGSEEFFSPGDSREDSCVYSLLGRELASTLLPCKSEYEGLRVSGFVSSPASGRGNRSAQYFFCNGRSIKSPLLQAALEQAYKNTLLTGRFPACVLYLDISCGSVDVNVHPAKTEVKFSSEKSVFDLVYNAVRAALEAENASLRPELSVEPKLSRRPDDSFYQSMSSAQFRERVSGKKSENIPTYAPPVQYKDKSLRPPKAAFSSTGVPYREQHSASRPLYAPIQEQITFPEKKISELPTNSSHRAVGNYVESVESSQNLQYRLVGEALKTYIIVEKEDELVLIDKHAAHERMIFDRLKARPGEIMSQQILNPVPVRLSPEYGELLEENSGLLSELGFEVEPFGENEYIIRALPADMASADAGAALEEICEKLRRGTAPDARSARDEILHTVACKAAIKAGWDTESEELDVLVRAVLSGDIKYCPHGRPLSVSLSKKELDKLFKRIV